MDPMTIQELKDAGLVEIGDTLVCACSESAFFVEGESYDVTTDLGHLAVLNEQGLPVCRSESTFVLANDDSFEDDAADLAAENNGGATDYYRIPEGATELNDLIEAKGMSFARGNIFKAVYRLGNKPGIDAIYDLNKIIYFAERIKGMIEKDQPL